jgi:hypothetical protein
MAKVLMSGSRNTTPEMLEIVQSTVWKLWWGHHEILVGDAVGVDAAVVKWAEKLALPYMAYGITDQARNGATNYLNVRDPLADGSAKYLRWARLFSERDKWMVDRADIVICISNVPSTKGTLAVYRYANQLHKPAILRTQLNERTLLSNLLNRIF